MSMVPFGCSRPLFEEIVFVPFPWHLAFLQVAGGVSMLLGFPVKKGKIFVTFFSPNLFACAHI